MVGNCFACQIFIFRTAVIICHDKCLILLLLELILNLKTADLVHFDLELIFFGNFDYFKYLLQQLGVTVKRVKHSCTLSSEKIVYWAVIQ